MYLLLVGKLYLWECRRNEVLPNIYGFQTKVSIKYETEKFICTKKKQITPISQEMDNNYFIAQCVAEIVKTVYF